jgi:hypothetical protein
MLTMEWPEGNRDDIDVHLMLPDGKVVNPQRGFIEAHSARPRRSCLTPDSTIHRCRTGNA